ncbi:putative lysosomal cobalamin transporter [Lineolata rhizophorae]|uniref:Probable lysosomal cobalamin transporter n=1 Tax=Lineolata rhizophorae TaxID=578093 RepID=A0A6A6P6Y5_9PEZI|nr:putative lysosomal cobalamin transporter [Lineolata rhizophorae]
MAISPTGPIWVAYAVAIAILFFVAAVFVFLYQAPRERSAFAASVCIFTAGALLATVLLLPADVALVSSTNSASLGRAKDWATPDRVDHIIFTLRVVYYTLYSLDAVLCLIVVPFAYFYSEERDQSPEDGDGGGPSAGRRFWDAFKYTLGFIVLVIIIFLVGFFVPAATKLGSGERHNLDYFKKLLTENRGERALTFALGLLITLGTLVYLIYTAAGLALLPVSLIRSTPSVSAPELAAGTSSELERNRERQRQLEARNEGREGGLDSRDRRELESLVREERTLVRRERLAAEQRGEGRSWIVRAWGKLEAAFRPFKLLAGLLLIVVAILVWVSMLITGIDKAKNSVCKARCGYVLGHANIFQPLNGLLVVSSRAFPVDYVLFLLLVLFFFAATVVGLATVGVRFLWVVLFRIRRRHSSPQALLVATVLLALVVLALNYAVAMVAAPQYATFGAQKFCDRPPKHPGEQPDCSEHKSAIKWCSELAENPAAANVCVPSVVSTFLNRITVNFPFFGAIDFWAQFAFMGIYLIFFVATLFRTPKMNTRQLDADLEEEEEEGLLASTGRRFNATWQDLTGRASKRQRDRERDYGTVGGGPNGGDDE